jgi:ELWxxDGT repeat protein
MRQSLVFALFLSAAGAFAQAPYLVKDLGNAGGSALTVSSTPNAFLSSGNTLFFTATTETNGLEPWVHDANGTRLLRDINAGTVGSNVLQFIELTPGVVIFGADDGVNGSQLWRSDGTAAGTSLIKVVNATTSFITASFAHGGKGFFFVNDGVHGREPWVTDGTAGGTQLLAETLPGTSGTSAWSFFRFNNTTYLFAAGGIWTTDGTPGGTTLSIPLAAYRLPVAVTAGAFYFFGYDAVHGYEPWKSDGTVAGTSMIEEIRSGVTTYSSAIAPTASGAVFFADDGGSGGGRLWTTGGTAANTFPLQAFPASGTANYVGGLWATSSGGVIVSAGGSNIWRTDGTEAGTYLSFAMNGPSFGFIDAFGKIYFSSYLGGSELTLFQFDGSQGATPVSVRPDVRVANVTATGGKLWFSGKDATNGSEPWVSDDGTTNGTHLVANLAPDPARSSKPVNLTPAGAYLYFHPEWPRELWRSDGTSGGTFELTDIDNNLGSPPPFASLTPFGGNVYYVHGHSDFYRVDGVNGAATKVGVYDIDAIVADETRMYLWGYGWASVLSSDGTAPGTIQLYDPNEPNHLRGHSDYITVLTHGGYGWIRCSHGLFRTAGTVATTQRVVSVPETSYLTGGFTAAGGLLYSVMIATTHGAELWRSDGSGGGSFVVKDANPGTASSNPSYLTPAGRLLFFTAFDPDHGTELWRSDGTAAGTFLVKDIRPGTASSAPSTLAAIGEVVYFAANDGTSGVELWKSDGTEAGTVLVRDIGPGPFSSRPSWLAAAGGRIWFSANDGLHGYELWSSDGTEGGTGIAGDIIPGSSSSSPDQMTPAESLLFFTATTDAEGRELWALPLTAGYVSVTGGRTAEGNTGTRALRFTIRRHGVSSGAASVAYATSPGTATAGTDYTPVAGTIDFAAGQTVKTVDVTIHGDTVTELNETLFLLLSSPAGVALQDAVGAGLIDDDDLQADLAAGLVQNVSSGEAMRMLKVTNLGPSNARAITVTFTESPYELSVYSPDGVTCTNTIPSQCTIPFLQPGESRTWRLSLSNKKGLVDPAMPPGQTVTVQVSAAVTDPVPSNNTASWMTTDNGMLLLPAKLVAGTSATATFDLGANAASATDVTLSSSAANVAVTPATARIEAGQRTASFTLTTSAGAGRTLLTATIAAQTQAALVVPVVANGQSPLLDVAIVADNQSTLEYGELFIIPVRVAARYPDGTVPAGLVTLFDENGTVLSQLALDTAGAATFTRPQPAPGQYQYRVGYSGDARFNPLTAALPAITVSKTRPTLTIHAPSLHCSSTVVVRVVLEGDYDGAPAPTGTVTLSAWQTNLGTYTLSPNGQPGQSEVTATVTFANGFSYIHGLYSGDGSFVTVYHEKGISIGCTAMNLVATATSTTNVALTWTRPVSTAVTTYDVRRATSIEGPFELITRTSGLSASDTTAQPGRVYVYYISASAALNPPFYHSAVEIASTFAYTDHPLVSGMRVKSAHLSELRTMVSALRTAAGLPALPFTGSVAPGNVVKAVHVAELRSSIDASRARLGLPAINWTQPNAVSGARIRAATLQELRGTAN